jgi:hypothetical protein
MDTALATGPRAPTPLRLRHVPVWRHDVSRWRPLRVVSLLWSALAGLPLAACSTPVCYYALENWPADPYALEVSANGPLPAALRERCERVLTGDGQALANAGFSFVEKTALPDSAPRVEVHSPSQRADRPPIWSGPLTPERLQALLDSPVRSRLVAELLDRAAAVFLFLPGGDPAADAAARSRLESALQEVSRTLRWPSADTDPAMARLPPPRFPILDVPRQDAAEEFLRAMLVASETDLADLHEPLAFPVFGRGRVLYALVGAGINRDVVAESCAFLTGSCSCEVKAQNPGVDLLLRAAWPQAELQVPTFTELAPLADLTAPAGDLAPPTPVTAPTPLPPRRLEPAAAATPLFAWPTLVVAAVALIAVVAGTVILLARTRSR